MRVCLGNTGNFCCCCCCSLFVFVFVFFLKDHRKAIFIGALIDVKEDNSKLNTWVTVANTPLSYSNPHAVRSFKPILAAFPTKEDKGSFLLLTCLLKDPSTGRVRWESSGEASVEIRHMHSLDYTGQEVAPFWKRKSTDFHLLCWDIFEL